MNIKRFLPIIGVIILIYLVFDIGPEKIFTSLSQIRPVYLIFIILLFIPRLIINTYKWQYICEKQKIFLNFSYLLKINLISYFYAIITPAGIGSYIRVYYIKEKSNSSLEKSISNTLLEISIETLVLCTFALIGSYLIIKEIPFFFPIIAVLLTIYLTLFILFIKREKSEIFVNGLLKYIVPRRFHEKITKSFNLFYEDFPKFREIIPPFFISATTWVLNFTQFYIAAVALSIDVPFFYFIMIYPISFIAASIPISIGGFGVREGALVLIFSIYGIASADIFAMSFVAGLITFIVPACIGGVLSFFKLND
jgi:uncharacterized protein (TIRG00374 family)